MLYSLTKNTIKGKHVPYSRNFLNKVIARVDHLPILILDEERPSSFQELIRNEYPRIDELRGIGIEMPKQGGSLVSVEKLPVIWKLNNKDRTIEIDLSSKYFSLVSSRYVGFLEFFDRLSDVYNHFVENYSPSIITRVGLRYVNEISLDGNPFEWQNLLNENLYSTLNAFPNMRSSFARSMHQLHFTGDDYKIVFQFGIFNSEFPNTIAKKEFILDYDCISEEEIEPQEVIGKFTRFNDLICELFEQSIGDGLREIMNEEG